MLLISLDTTNAHFNLAAEEYLLKEKEEDIFMLWRNDNAIIVGKNQNSLGEINREKAEEKNVAVVRRLTGGGAVYHDLGNLNYTFIMKNDGSDFLNFRKFSEPVIKALNEMGVKASLSGRNDLLIEDKKFSGNAQCVHKNRMLHHGTLMFKTNINLLSEVLNVDRSKIESKGIASVKSRVTNISEHLPDKSITVTDFRDKLLQSVAADLSGAVMYSLTDEDVSAINKLKSEKYDTWEWNFGFSPKYTFNKNMRFTGGSVEAYLYIKNGVIESAKIRGDFFAKNDISEFEMLLLGTKHECSEILRQFDKVDIKKYFGNISKDEIMRVLI